MSRSTLRRCTLSAAVVMALAAPAAAGQAEATLSAINGARAEAGCPALVLNPQLNAAARNHARAMAEQDFFGHAGRDGSRLGNRIKRQGYSYRSAAENIAAGQSSVTQVVRGWLQSAGHRRNILNCGMRETGIAVVYEADDRPLRGSSYPLRYYWVQVFAAP
ncbi:MAG: CAP domain-containing protein [Tabrizicola sp.]|uniref:CAP domain-containing protein n=1 Tax=Tabrizicola sp. TaxID=2005166 RepID=UPI0027354F89|nr:CAP domain-containing protein [Tabrizicola sp.]MDP3262114.1 CAP domain-containing protein [Tabrizicola sp.]MDP3648140.1 CAP domain-containing protein [Paracoccaceae bacterium]MDZ4066061.1 CAP domain-containing protein [Tabrizicola sp.]